jgi:ssDNA-binding replication factor A large subunit
VNINLGQGDRGATLTLQQEGDRVTGSIAGVLGSGEISNASMSASDELRFTVSLNLEGQTKEATFTGTLAGNEIRGSVAVVGMTPGTFTATRAARPN